MRPSGVADAGARGLGERETMRTQFERRRLSRAALAAFFMALPLGGACALADTPTPASPGRVVVLKPPAAPAPESVADVPAALLRPGATFTLAQVVDLALANSPLTRTSYRRARSEAADLGSKRGAYFPTIDASGSAAHGQQPTGDQQGDAIYTTYGPALTLNYLLLDFGGRGAQVEEARQSLLAADWSHNAMVQDVILGVQETYVQYQDAKAQLAAARTNVTQAADQPRRRERAARRRRRHDRRRAAGADGAVAGAAQRRRLRGPGARPARRAGHGDGAAGQPPVRRRAASRARCRSTRAQPTVDALIADARLRRPDLAALRALAEKAGGPRRRRPLRGAAEPVAPGRRQPDVLRPRPRSTSTTTSGRRGCSSSVPLFTGFAKTYDVRRPGRTPPSPAPRPKARAAGDPAGVDELLRPADRQPARPDQPDLLDERRAVRAGGAGALQGGRRHDPRPAHRPGRARQRAGPGDPGPRRLVRRRSPSSPTTPACLAAPPTASPIVTEEK